MEYFIRSGSRIFSLLSLILLLIIASPPATSGQTQSTSKLSGNWKGQIKIPGSPLTIKTHFKKSEDTYSGTIDIPQQMGHDIPLQKVSVADDDSLFFEFMAGPGLAEFKGKFNSDSTIAGSFHQRGMQFPFKLKRYEPKADSAKKSALVSKAYNQKDMIIKNDSIKIGGTLTWPKEGNTDQLVIMISGSGAQDRDATMTPLSDFKPFALLADSLTANGIATFRYDDRGVDQSTGNFAQTSLEMLASDVDAIIHYFKNEADQQFDEIILLGHSQGGVVGGKIAAKSSQVDKLILMASTGMSLKDVLRFQVRQRYEQTGISDSLIEAEISARERIMERINNGANLEQAKKEYFDRFHAVQLALGADSAKASTAAKNQSQQLATTYSSPQFKSLLFYNPTRDLAKLHIPVLVLFGGKDTQVPVGMNKTPIEEALEKAGVEYEIRVFEHANHPFQKAKTGAVSEYGKLENEFMDGFLQTIERWIKKDY